MSTIGVFVVTPILLISFIFYPVYAFFKGLTDNNIYDDYSENIKTVLSILNYPIQLWEDRMNKHKEMVEKLNYYRERYNEYLEIDGKKVDGYFKIKAIVEDLQEHTKISVLTTEYLNEKLDEILKKLEDE